MARTPRSAAGAKSNAGTKATPNGTLASAKKKKMPKNDTPHPRGATEPVHGAHGPQQPVPAARRSPSPQPGASPWSTPAAGGNPTTKPNGGTTPSREPKPKPTLFGVSRSPHSSFNVDEILGKALSCQKSPMTNKAELRLHEELSRTPCPIISEYAKKDKLHAMGCRWDKELKTWTSTNLNLVREHRNIVVFNDGFIPPR